MDSKENGIGGILSALEAVDYETYWDEQVSLQHMSIQEYIANEKFEVFTTGLVPATALDAPKVFVAHHAPFDWAVLMSPGMPSLGVYSHVLCTKWLAQQVMPGLGSYSLDKLSRELLGKTKFGWVEYYAKQYFPATTMGVQALASLHRYCGLQLLPMAPVHAGLEVLVNEAKVKGAKYIHLSREVGYLFEGVVNNVFNCKSNVVIPNGSEKATIVISELALLIEQHSNNIVLTETKGRSEFNRNEHEILQAYADHDALLSKELAVYLLRKAYATKGEGYVISLLDESTEYVRGFSKENAAAKKEGEPINLPTGATLQPPAATMPPVASLAPIPLAPPPAPPAPSVESETPTAPKRKAAPKKKK